MRKAVNISRFKHGTLAALLTLSVFVGSVSFPKQVSAFAGGDGSVGDPYQISNCNQLNGMGTNESDSNKNFILTADINCTGVSFQAISFGEDSLAFNGQFDGNNRTISNITINQGENYYLGLFAQLSGALVMNLNLSNISITGQSHLGALAGRAFDESNIQDVHVTSGSVNGADNSLGGLVGQSEDSNYQRVTANVTVTAQNSAKIGGLIGAFYSSSIEESAAYGSVSGGSQYIGGLFGDTSESEMFWVHAKGDVSATAHTEYSGSAGGLIGYSGDNTMIASAYALGKVTGSDAVGGLVGSLTNDSAVAYSYAANEIEMNSDGSNGGLIGTVSGGGYTEDTTFWDAELSGLPTSGASSEVGKTTAEMKTMDTFLPWGWDFDDVPIWGMTPSLNQGYPCHSWENGCYEGEDDDDQGSDNSSLPNDGDGNNDGTVDSEQDNVVTLLSPVSEKYVTVAVDDSCELADVSVANASIHTAKDIAFDYQSGFVNFTASGCESDETIVNLYYHGIDKNDFTVRKYNPNTGIYFTIAGASLSGLESPLFGTLVTYTIIDNGDLDLDPTDGVIVDPVGLGMNTVSSPNTGLGNVADYIFVRKH